MLCFCCIFNLWVVTKLGMMKWGEKGLGSSNRSDTGERTTEGTIGCGACSQLARVEVRGF